MQLNSQVLFSFIFILSLTLMALISVLILVLMGLKSWRIWKRRHDERWRQAIWPILEDYLRGEGDALDRLLKIPRYAQATLQYGVLHRKPTRRFRSIARRQCSRRRTSVG